MKGSAIRHLSSSWSGTIVAAGEFESTVSIWDLVAARKTAEFPTILDFGGARLAIDESGRHCVAGAYRRHGICCYSAQSGEPLWQRKDLRKAQKIRILPSQSEVACGFENRPLHILSMITGETLQSIPGCRDIVVSRFDAVQLVDKIQPELQKPDGSTLIALNRESFALLSVAFGHNAVVISETRGFVRCFDTTAGQPLWHYKSPQGSHILSVGYNSSEGQFHAIEWPFERGGEKTLLTFEPNSGKIESRFSIGPSSGECFCMAGSRLLSSSGWLLDTVTERIVGHFGFPLMDYP